MQTRDLKSVYNSPNPGGAKAPPIISFVGKSNSGKTTFLEKLIPELKRRGFRLGVIKHDAHSFNIDHPGKDSFRLKNAGADTILISSSSKIALIKDVSTDIPLQELSRDFLEDVDLILTEGCKRENAYKIEVSRRESFTEFVCTDQERIAVIADWFPETESPLFDLEDVIGVADLIKEMFFGD